MFVLYVERIYDVAIRYAYMILIVVVSSSGIGVLVLSYYSSGSVVQLYYKCGTGI